MEWFALICHCEERSDVAPPPTMLCNLAIQNSEQIKPAPVMGAGLSIYSLTKQTTLSTGVNLSQLIFGVVSFS